MFDDAGTETRHLLTEQQQGKEWVAYPDIEKVGKGDLRTFTTKDEAQQFVNDHSNVAVMYDYHAIGRILDALTPLVAAAIDKSFGKDQDHNHKRDNNKDQDSELER